MKLKYGMNPYQGKAEIDLKNELELLNGNPSYINFLDALNSWQLVMELEEATGSAAATSFKHVSPSGAAVGAAFLPGELASYNYPSQPETQQSAAYLKARGSDRLASFGDFIAVSETVEEELARLVRSEVSDGIIAPGYSEKALEILKTKKKGGYCVLKINKEYRPAALESRELFGFKLKQERNHLKLSPEMLKNVRTGSQELPDAVVTSLLAGLITLKYTQSNSLSVAVGGHVIGVGAGQQSRILCSDLALTKANKWYQKTRLDYDSLDYAAAEKLTKTAKDLIHDQAREALFGSRPLLAELDGVCLCSDAFFPQTDNIELAHKFGVKYIAAPMGSIRDEEILAKCEAYGISFIELECRLFHH